MIRRMSRQCPFLWVSRLDLRYPGLRGGIMSPMGISTLMFVCVFGGALGGLLLRATLPQRHLSAESTDIVKLGTGLVATMAALVLALLIASAKSSYDTQRSDLTQMAVHLVLLDRVLASYGPETHEARQLLRRAVAQTLTQMWPEDRAQRTQLAPTEQGLGGFISARKGGLYDTLQALTPQQDAQRALQAEALSLTRTLGQTRWLMFEQRVPRFPGPSWWYSLPGSLLSSSASVSWRPPTSP